MPGLGEIPASATLRAYYHLEDVNDATSNARNLTNQNTVSFAAGRYTNGADFGSSGTNKGLTLGTNPFSTGQPTDCSFSFWAKLNTSASANTNTRFFELVSINNSTSGMRLICFYNIAAGNITFTWRIVTNIGNYDVTKTVTADTNWHAYLFRKVGTNMAINIDMGTVSNATYSGTPTTSGVTVTYPFVIGNNSPLGTQTWSVMDEFIIYESNFSPSAGYYNYYTQALGRFCI